ncbi:MAG: DUF4173 domain-containing protein [Patescibacteria group bacterium]
MENSSPLWKIPAIAALALGLGIFFDKLFFGYVPGISFPIFCLAMLAVIALLLRKFKPDLIRSAWPYAVLILFFSSMVAIRAAEFLTFLNICVTIFLFLVLVDHALGGRLPRFTVLEYLKTGIVLPLRTVASAFEGVGDLFASRTALKEHKSLGSVLRGILLALPMVILFLLLFSSADLVFKKYLTGIIDINIISGDTIFMLFRILIITGIFLGALRLLVHVVDSPAKSMQIARRLGDLEIAVFLGILNAVFFTFIVIQLTYLFGGQQNITAQGFTYADYARRGFFELIAAAALSLVLIWGAERSLAVPEQKLPQSFRWLASGLVIQVLIMMISAFKRLSLYEQAYGFTNLRFYSHVAIILIAIILILFVIKTLLHKQEHTWLFASFISALAVLAIVNFMNPEAFIARKNIEQFGRSDKLDTNYLVELSSDAMPEIIKHLPLVNLAGSCFFSDQSRQLHNVLKHWPSWNLSRRNALRLLDSDKFWLWNQCDAGGVAD